MIQAKLIDHMGSDLSVVNAARVSYGKRKEAIDESDIKLIDYLGKHKHYSPFGHCFATFHCSAPIYVARQLVKHKFLRWNEISRRYVDSEPQFDHPRSFRGKPVDSKQGSSGELADPGGHLHNSLTQAHLSATKLYTYLLDRGVCPEQARMVLPQSTITEWFWSGSLDAFAEMCYLRCKGDTQKETQRIAMDIAQAMSSLYPHSWQGYLQWK